MRVANIPLIIGAVAALMMAGCGSSHSGAGAALTAAYVKQATAICSRGHRQARAVSTEGPDLTKTVMPVLQRTIDELAHTGIPSGNEKQLDAFILAFGDEIHTNLTPRLLKSLGQLEGKFAKSAAMAVELGLSACALG